MFWCDLLPSATGCKDAHRDGCLAMVALNVRSWEPGRMTVLKVRDLMTERVDVLQENEDVDLAAMLMRLEQLHHLPVVREGKVVGVVSHRDILKAGARNPKERSPDELRAFHLGIPVRDIMTPTVLTVAPDAPLLEAAEILRDEGIGCLPVMDGDELVGIITRNDFLRLVIQMLSYTGEQQQGE
jgi:CBS domain-containing membrane protein